MDMEEKEIMAELEQQFGAELATIPARTVETLPRMRAVFRITNAYLNRSGASGRKQLTIETDIIESDAGAEFVGKTYKKNWGLETVENIQWLKKDMRCLELGEPADAKDIAALCGQLVGICFSGQLVPNTEEGFPPNCFINPGARRHELEMGAKGGTSL